MQIVPGLYSLGDNSGGRVRAFLIDDGRELTIVDSLLNSSAKLVLAELEALGRKPKDITRILLTHAHQSHLGGLRALKKATGARVYAHEFEAEIIEGKKKMRIPPTTGLMPQKPYRLWPMQVAFVMGWFMPPPTPVDAGLKDGDHVGPLTVIHAPGHTPGSMAFYWPEKRALIAGDIVSTWPEVALGWPMITIDNKQNRESVGKLCDITQAEILCVGHGQPIVSGAAETMRDLVAGRQTQPHILT